MGIHIGPDVKLDQKTREKSSFLLYMWGNQKSGARIELIGLEGGESKIKSNRLEPVHLIDDPAARLGLELGAPISSGGGGGAVGSLRGPPVGVHGRGSAMAASRGA